VTRTAREAISKIDRICPTIFRRHRLPGIKTQCRTAFRISPFHWMIHGFSWRAFGVLRLASITSNICYHDRTATFRNLFIRLIIRFRDTSKDRSSILQAFPYRLSTMSPSAGRFLFVYKTAASTSFSHSTGKEQHNIQSHVARATRRKSRPRLEHIKAMPSWCLLCGMDVFEEGNNSTKRTCGLRTWVALQPRQP
jgi:hypothetical protein